MATIIASQPSYVELWASLESPDNASLKEVLATHSHDGRKVDVKSILNIIENILLRATPSTLADAPSGSLEDKTILQVDKIAQTDTVVKLKALTDIIKKISTELSNSNVFVTATIDGNNLRPSASPFATKMTCNCKCPGGGDVFATTTTILKTLSNYSWDAKVVLTLAAFALNYGEIFLLAPPYSNGSSSISQSLALLKQLRDITENSLLSKPKYDSIVKLVKVIVGVARCIVDFTDLPLEGIAVNLPPLSTAVDYIPKAAYWAILSTVISASHIASLKASQESTTQPWDLSRLAIEGTRIQELLKNQLTICKGQIAEKSKTAYWHLVRDICDVRQPDSMKILKTLIFDKHGWPYLVDRAYRRIGMEELRDKSVLLLISGLDISKEEILTLGKLYQEAQMRPDVQYHVLWIPIVDKTTTWDQDKQQKFEKLLSLMPWYTVPEPSKIKAEVIKYIKKVWEYTGKTMLVPLDPQGRVQSMNALDMLWIWGNSAFPFFHGKEESLWEMQSWTIDLFIDGIDKNIINWVTQEGKFVCLYGGEDIDWIREFTSAAKLGALAAGIPIELVYVGKNNALKQVEKIIKIIDAEKLSYYWTDLASTWFFWTRLESMLYLKMQQGKNFKNDNIMREVTTLLAYDASDKGWALFCKGTSSMTKAKGDVALKSMKHVHEWKDNATAKGFLPALNEYFQRNQAMQSNNRIILTGNRREIPGHLLSSSGCDCSMEKCFLYHCYAE
ncbi:hypothetical protein Tsubulata_048065 [Turnera subulata]|uniref:Sieve element occlusion N-terminal domain-containing protein n=1 Tax=Turnera subulata TaxID=218843 RepID=A0A9Q0EZS8_9ROSI|nr:hypothetical protein Tsubulata_048065 [Turnera subulata]